MILLTLLKLAKERELKRVGDTVFGVVNGQLVAITRMHQEMHRIQVTLLQDVPELLDRLRNSKTLTALVSKRSIQLDKKTCTISVTFSRRVANKPGRLDEILEEFTKEISTHYQPQFRGEVVLWGERTYPRANIDREATELPAAKFEQHPIIASLCAILACIALGSFFGMLGFGGPMAALWFMSVFTAIALLVLAKFTKKWNLFFRTIATLAAFIGYVAYAGCSIYFKLHKKYDISAEVLLMHLKVMWQENWIVIVLATVLSATFSFKARPRPELSDAPILEGSLIDAKELDHVQELEVIGRKILWVALGGILYGFAGVFLACIKSYADRTVIFPRTTYYFFASVAVLFCVVIVLEIRSLRKPEKNPFDGPPWTPRWFLGVFICLLIAGAYSAGNCGIIVLLNAVLDHSKPQTLITSLGAPIQYTSHKDVCYGIKDWKSSGEFAHPTFCLDKYGPIRPDDQVEVIARPGALGMSWLESYSLARFRDFKTLLASLSSEGDLRFTTVEYFSKISKDKVELNTTYRQRWNQQCETQPGVSCRLAGYLEDIDGNINKAHEFFLRGCRANDRVACLGLFARKGATVSDKAQYFDHLKTACDKNAKDGCFELAQAYANDDYKIRYPEVINLLGKACSVGEQRACVQLEKLKMFPPK